MCVIEIPNRKKYPDVFRDSKVILLTDGRIYMIKQNIATVTYCYTSIEVLWNLNYTSPYMLHYFLAFLKLSL